MYFNNNSRHKSLNILWAIKTVQNIYNTNHNLEFLGLVKMFLKSLGFIWANKVLRIASSLLLLKIGPSYIIYTDYGSWPTLLHLPSHPDTAPFYLSLRKQTGFYGDYFLEVCTWLWNHKDTQSSLSTAAVSWLWYKIVRHF